MNNTLSTKINRDYQLDAYRALMMIYVPCVIHVLYWLDKGSSIINSLALFEMPVIFYISGATMYITGKKRGFIELLSNRAKRVLLPYYFFIFGCLTYIIVSLLIAPNLVQNGKYSIIKIFLAQDRSLPVPFMIHLWFILPYLIVSCSFAIQQKWANKLNRWKYMVILLVLCCLSTALTPINPTIAKPIREAIFYNFFFMAGYLFYKRISFKTLLNLTILTGIIVAISIYKEWTIKGYFSMQIHKFPPDLIFISFGIFSIGLLALFFGNFTIPQNRLLNHWNKYGYTIYLWQNFSFFIYTIIYRYCGLKFLENYPIIDFFAATFGIFIISMLTSLVIIRAEQSFIHFVTAKKKQPQD